MPAAHYTCGGVIQTSRRADLAGLYVVGEASCTGLRRQPAGQQLAARMRMVFARAAVTDMKPRSRQPRSRPSTWDDGRVIDADEQVVLSQ